MRNAIVKNVLKREYYPISDFRNICTSRKSREDPETRLLHKSRYTSGLKGNTDP